MEHEISLSDLSVDESAKIDHLLISGSMRRRLTDIGFVKDTKIKCVGKSPCGDPLAFLVRGAVIAIREEDGKKIIVRRV